MVLCMYSKRKFNCFSKHSAIVLPLKNWLTQSFSNSSVNELIMNRSGMKGNHLPDTLALENASSY